MLPTLHILLFAIGLTLGQSSEQSISVQEGDVVFQTSRSSQSQAIQLATKSRYSHMGIILYKEEKPFVFEAIQPVKFTPWEAWIKRGQNGHCVVKRLKNGKSLLTDATIKKIHTLARSFEGKDYDLAFSWNDSRMYCSELVWKLYDRAVGIQVGKLQKLKEFDLSSPIVQKKMKQRYGSKIPLSETVVSPQAMFDSDLLVLVKEIS